MMKALALILTLLAFPAVVFADAVDEFLLSQMQRHQIPGISLAICRDGQVVRAMGYGLANVELDVPAKPGPSSRQGP